jgi:hypothetical protein
MLEERREYKMNTQNIREVLFQVTLEGNGIVQRDSNDQKWMYQKSENHSPVPSAGGKAASNFSLAKANYYKDGEKIIRKIKISSAWIRHEIHVESIPFYTPQMFSLDVMRKKLIASPDYLLRGYLHAPTKDSLDVEITKRKSPYQITDAEEISGVIPCLEARSTTGPRNDTSFFADETVGATKYQAEGSLNISLLRFVSTSSIADRRAIKDNDKEDFKKNFEGRFGEGTVEHGLFFNANSDMQHIAESGFMISDNATVDLVNILFNQMAKVSKTARNASAKITSIKVKMISNPFEDMADEWEEIFNINTPKKIELHFTPANMFAKTTWSELNESAVSYEGTKSKEKK